MTSACCCLACSMSMSIFSELPIRSPTGKSNCANARRSVFIQVLYNYPALTGTPSQVKGNSCDHLIRKELSATLVHALNNDDLYILKLFLTHATHNRHYITSMTKPPNYTYLKLRQLPYNPALKQRARELRRSGN